MSSDDFDIPRRKLLGALGTIGGAAALGGASTMAFFSDTEEFANNSLTAGELDLKLAWQEQYFGAAAEQSLEAGAGSANDFFSLPGATLESYPDQASGAGASFADLGAQSDPCGSQQSLYADAPDDLDPSTGFRSNNDDTMANGQVRPLISIQDAKPGDFGFTQFRLLLCDNPGYIWQTGGIQSLQENGQTEPERKDPQSSGPGAQDIADEIRVRVFQDQSGGAVASFFGGLDPSTTGPELVEAVFDFFQLGTAPTLREFSDALSSGSGFPLDGDPFGGASAAGVTKQTADGDLFLYDLAGGQTSGERECFDAASAANLGLVWGLAVDHANEIQGDSVGLDVGYYTEQCRHNDPDGTAAGEQVTVEQSLDPRATYLRTNSDPNAADAMPVDLAGNGIEPGDTVRLEVLGDYSVRSGGPDSRKRTIAVFSGSDTLLGDSQLDRVADAIDAGDDVATPNTFYGDEQTDVAEDFEVDPTVEVAVPSGATHLFAAAYDNFYGDNNDPDGDYGVRITTL